MTVGRMRIVIVGAGGLGREVLQLARDLSRSGADLDCIGFFVEAGFTAPDMVDGMPVIRDFSALASDPAVRFVLGIGSPAARARFARRAGADGVRFATLIHPSAYLGDTVAAGDGTLILPFASLTAHVRVGHHVLVNPHVSISHDCVLEDFATLAPAVALAGGVHVGTGAELGIRATVAPRLRVGSWSMTGAGAVVIRPVEDNATAAGVPARTIATRPAGWQEHA